MCTISLGIYLGIKFVDQRTHPSYLYLVMTLFSKQCIKLDLVEQFMMALSLQNFDHTLRLIFIHFIHFVVVKE